MVKLMCTSQYSNGNAFQHISPSLFLPITTTGHVVHIHQDSSLPLVVCLQ